MTGIVEKLRWLEICEIGVTGVTHDLVVGEVCTEAADTIESLTARIEQLEGAIHSALSHRYGDWPSVLRQALDAGKEKPE